jgi:hypothetical protein
MFTRGNSDGHNSKNYTLGAVHTCVGLNLLFVSLKHLWGFVVTSVDNLKEEKSPLFHETSGSNFASYRLLKTESINFLMIFVTV